MYVFIYVFVVYLTTLLVVQW